MGFWRDTHWRLQERRFGKLATASNRRMFSDLIAENGSTFEEVARKSASEMQFLQRLAGESNVPIELISKRWPEATQLLAAINTPPETPEPPAGLIGEQGEKGVQPLLDILEKVGTGIMDRDSAVQTLVNLYGLDFDKADAMVPQPRQDLRKGLNS
jgi:hypothetical protein